MADATALAEGGVDAIMVENFGSAPFPKGDASQRVPPHQLMALGWIARVCRERFELPVGVNCLRNDAMGALGVAAAAGLDLVRVNVHMGAYVTDQGVIEGEAYHSLRYRQSLGAENVAILADVLVKHAAPLAPLDAAAATKELIGRGHANGVIVTGQATGATVDRSLLEEVRVAAGEAAVFIGSGLTPELADELAPLVDGAIVGTWLKVDGVLSNPVDAERVQVMADAVRGKWRVRG